MELIMSLLARKSDLKNHLSHNVKRHLITPLPTNPTDDMGVPGEGTSGAGDTTVVRNDVDQRSSSESADASKAVVDWR
jgi:hypothetical protein